MLQYVIAGLVLGGIYAIALGGAGHHLRVVGHLELRLRRHGLLHRPPLLLPPHPAELGHPARRPSSSIVVAGPAHGRLPLRRPVPVPAALVAADQGRGHHRAARSPSLRSPPSSSATRPSSGTGPGARAGPRLQRSSAWRSRWTRSSSTSAWSRPSCIGALVLRYTEVGLKVRAMVDSPAMTEPVGHQPERHLGRRLGGEHVLRRAGRRAGRTHHRARPRQLHAADRRCVRRRRRRPAPQPAHRRRRSAWPWASPRRSSSGTCRRPSTWTTEIIDAVPFIVHRRLARSTASSATATAR